MIKGIGVDAVSISKTEMLLTYPESSYAEYTYTSEELKQASGSTRKAEYLAARFAAKEAVYKSVAPQTKEGFFDMRCIEVLNRADGSPYVSVSEKFRKVLEESDISAVHVSITTENDMVIAFAVAEG